MDEMRDMETALRQMRRILALLWSLADLAESAACRSAPVRLFVLWLLARGEAVASDYVFTQTGYVAPEPMSVSFARHDAADALLLAARFRVLAAALAAFVAALVMTRRAELCHAPGALPAPFGALAHAACPVSPVGRFDSS